MACARCNLLFRVHSILIYDMLESKIAVRITFWVGRDQQSPSGREEGRKEKEEEKETENHFERPR